MADEPIKVVFDCNVIWQAFFSATGPSARCKKLVDSGEVTLFLSIAVLEEIRDVLLRPKTRAKFPTLTSEAVEAFLQDLVDKATLQKSVPNKFTGMPDPKDEPYINLALAAGASYIVSRDRDLLDLMRWDTEDGRDFQKRFRSLKIVRPETFLEEIEKAKET